MEYSPDKMLEKKIRHLRGTIIFLSLFLLSVVSLVSVYIYSINVFIEEERVFYKAEIWELQFDLSQLRIERKNLMEANENLKESLAKENHRAETLLDRLNEITGEVETIKKLEEIDPELLKKYSKVYFLNENYEPSGLVEIPEKFLAPDKEEEYFHKKAWPFLREMMEDAKYDGVNPEIVSGYRSFDEQTELKAKYDIIYGEGTANQFSAYQGYSEHQLGTTIDITTKEMEGSLLNFEQTKLFTWLEKNAHKYGFVLSYPENNQSYIYEPWHWRFVGIKLATDIYKRGEYFYDLDQREIDGYRLYLFDR